jgi:hypothetical protein
LHKGFVAEEREGLLEPEHLGVLVDLLYEGELPGLEFGEVLELDLEAEGVGVVALMWWCGGGGVEEDMLSCERGEVICSEVDSPTSEEEGDVDEVFAGVAWAGVLCVVGVLGRFVGFSVLLKAVKEDLVAYLC